MTTVPTATIREGVKNIAREGGDIFTVLAGRTRDAINRGNQTVRAHGGFRATYSAAYQAAPVSTVAITGAAIGGTGIVGAHMARGLSDSGRGRSQERDGRQ